MEILLSLLAGLVCAGIMTGLIAVIPFKPEFEEDRKASLPFMFLIAGAIFTGFIAMILGALHG